MARRRGRKTGGMHVEFLGAEDLERALDRIVNRDLRDEAIQDSLLEAAEPLRAEMARRMPRSDVPGGTTGKGHAADHFFAQREGSRKVHVGPDEDHWYVNFAEFGTPTQPALAPQRRAVDSHSDDVAAEFARLLRRRLERVGLV